MKVEQFVMAYGAEQDRLRAILPENFTSLRPVLRINAEIYGGNLNEAYVEFNTAVESGGKRGWLNIAHWNDFKCESDGKTFEFSSPFLQMKFSMTGIEGGCPAEKDNDGCFFLGESCILRPAEKIAVNKTFYDCEFKWKFTDNDAHGVSIGKTLPAIPTEAKTQYEKLEFTAQNAAAIKCEQVLGAYCVKFQR